MEKGHLPKLEIQNISKKYRNGDGVSHISFTVWEGEFLTMLGPSGCGKTTILRAIGGFIPVDSGDIRIDGRSITNLPPEKRPTAMVFQSYNLWSHMTVYDNLAFGLQIRHTPRAEIAARIRDILGLVRMQGSEKKYPGQLSGGQQQRVAIARSLLLRPSVLLLDEPFSALDAKIRAEMREELKRIQMELHITVVFVTHDQEEAMSISDRLVVMNKGVFEQIGTPTEIYDNPATRYVASFIGDMNFFPGRGGEQIAVRPEELHVVPAGEGADGVPGVVRTVMVLGHYAQVNIQTQTGIAKAFLPRAAAAGFNTEEEVTLCFKPQHVFPAD